MLKRKEELGTKIIVNNANHFINVNKMSRESVLLYLVTYKKLGVLLNYQQKYIKEVNASSLMPSIVDVNSIEKNYGIFAGSYSKEYILLLKQIKKASFRAISSLKRRKLAESLFAYHKRIINVKKLSLLCDVSIRVMSHNVYCTLIGQKILPIFNEIQSSKQLTIVRSAGSYKMSITRRNYRVTVQTVIKKFLKEIRKYISQIGTASALGRKVLRLNLMLPYHIRSKFVSHVAKIFLVNRCEVIVNLCEKKVFNGCRAKKKRRKKRMGRRFFV
jgi:hypothetical protein